MIDPLIERELRDQLDQLGVEQQRQVLNFARALTTAKPMGMPGNALLSFAGAIAPDDLETMAQAIEDGCEQINLNEW